MKRVFLIIAFLLSTHLLDAQKFGYINTEFILNRLPEYAEINGELSQFTTQWQQEIHDIQLEISSLRNNYVAEKVLLTAEMQRKREEEIESKEKELQDFQKKIFGFEGLYFLKKQELIEPLQDKIFTSAEKVAKAHRLAILFDKADVLIMIYTDPRHDYTDFVLEDLGLGDPIDVIK